MGEARTRSLTRVVVATSVLALFAAALLLSACGEPAAVVDDAFAGHWAGGGTSGMRLVHIVKDGDAYTVFANPDYKAPTPTLENGTLVIDTHAVETTLIPAGTDELTLELTGAVLDAPETTALKRVSETQYADAAVALGLASIRSGLDMWQAGGKGKYPPASEVMPTGALGQMTSWPKNLFTGQPMQPGETPGDFVYKQLDGGKKYSLKAYLSDGSTIGK